MLDIVRGGFVTLVFSYASNGRCFETIKCILDWNKSW